MAMRFHAAENPHLGFLIEAPPSGSRGVAYLSALGGSENTRLATDSLGTFSLTLTNVVVGSVLQAEIASTGVVVSNVVAASSTVALTAPAYVPGSASNDLRIKVRKGTSSPYYIPYETLLTAFVGSQSIYVSQIPDE